MQSMGAYDYRVLYRYTATLTAGQHVRTWTRADKVYCSVVNLARNDTRDADGIEPAETFLLIANDTRAVGPADRIGDASGPLYDVVSVKTYPTTQHIEVRACK